MTLEGSAITIQLDGGEDPFPRKRLFLKRCQHGHRSISEFDSVLNLVLLLLHDSVKERGQRKLDEHTSRKDEDGPESVRFASEKR